MTVDIINLNNNIKEIFNLQFIPRTGDIIRLKNKDGFINEYTVYKCKHDFVTNKTKHKIIIYII